MVKARSMFEVLWILGYFFRIRICNFYGYRSGRPIYGIRILPGHCLAIENTVMCQISNSFLKIESLTTIKDTDPGGKLTTDPSDPDPQKCEKSNIIEQLINKDSLLQTLKLPDTLVGSLKMNTALEYSTRVVQEGDRRCKKSTLNDLAYLTPLKIPLMNPVTFQLCAGTFPNIKNYLSTLHNKVFKDLSKKVAIFHLFLFDGRPSKASSRTATERKAIRRI
jgi:hypothetical protein